MAHNISLSNQKIMETESKTIGARLAKTEFIVRMAELFSLVIGEEVSPEQALVILNTMAALTMLIFSAGIPVVGRVMCLVWFVASLVQCKMKGLGEEH